MTDSKVELTDVALNNYRGYALYIQESFTSETTVVATRCEFANSMYGAVVEGSITSATFKNCVFHDNENEGIQAYASTIHLHGDATAIHSNKSFGIFASVSAKVIIHLPSHHNTIYNNEQQDPSILVVLHHPHKRT